MPAFFNSSLLTHITIDDELKGVVETALKEFGQQFGALRAPAGAAA